MLSPVNPRRRLGWRCFEGNLGKGSRRATPLGSFLFSSSIFFLLGMRSNDGGANGGV